MLALRFNGPRYADRFGSDLGLLVHDFFGGFPDLWDAAPFARTAYPALSVWQDETSVFVEASVPGLKPENLELTVVDNELILKGRRESERKSGDVAHCHEIRVGEFTRVIALPVEVDTDRISATLRDGVLEVTLPKAESAKPHKIEVTVGR